MIFVAFEALELELNRQGYKYICGVDEAGRGPLAAPVFAAAVILKEDADLEGLNDSKKLTEKKREELYDKIISQSIAYSIMYVDEKTIDEINILNATMGAMKAAVSSLKVKPDAVLVDGNKAPQLDVSLVRTEIKGDARIKSIAAASVLAKVARDRYMIELDKKYPQYQFSKHKGYGTKLHYQMLDLYGASEVHRMSFLKKYFEGKKNA